jgi:hypothetical protein
MASRFPRTRNRTGQKSFVGLANIPESIRGLSSLERPDYVDLFAIDTARADRTTPEQWARTLFEETMLGHLAPNAWRSLRFRLGPRPSRDHVQGLKIVGVGEQWIRIETTSGYITLQFVVITEQNRLLLALFVHYDKPVAAVIFAPFAWTHRRSTPIMLRQGLQTRDKAFLDSHPA